MSEQVIRGEPVSDCNKILGTWYLRSAFAVDEGNNRLYDLYGEEPSGVIHYLSDGRMSVLITHDGRKLMSGDRQAAPEGQRAEAFSGCIAYAGSFSLHDDGWIHHIIDVSTYPNWVGSKLKRRATYDGKTLSLLTPPQMQNGKITILNLHWQRNIVNIPQVFKEKE